MKKEDKLAAIYSELSSQIIKWWPKNDMKHSSLLSINNNNLVFCLKFQGSSLDLSGAGYTEIQITVRTNIRVVGKVTQTQLGTSEKKVSQSFCFYDNTADKNNSVESKRQINKLIKDIVIPKLDEVYHEYRDHYLDTRRELGFL